MTRETSIIWAEDIPALKIEALSGGCVIVECEDPFGNGDASIQLHPIHLRLIAEKLGLVREMSASDAEILRTLRGQLADSARTVSTLVRRMRAITARIDHLGEYLACHSDTEHADLSYEQGYANATCDINDEFCADLDELLQRFGNAGAVTEVTLMASGQPHSHVTPGAATSRPVTPESAEEPSGAHADNPVGSAKACANPSGKASAKASVNPSGKGGAAGTGLLFGGDHG